MNRSVSLYSISFALAALVCGCETEEPTLARVENAYPSAADGGDTTAGIVVYKLWWTSTLFSTAIVPGETSDEQRVVPDTDYAYALIAPGWDAASGEPPERLLAVRSTRKLSVRRGDTLEIRVSDHSFQGSCDAGQALSQGQADFITQRIFPGDFAERYDAATCTAVSVAAGSPAD